jgi:diguanylate cyclase (GGDEF)-like protein
MAREKILIVDDDASSLEIIDFILEQEGYVIEHTYSAVETFLKLSNYRPDLMIIKVELPETSGLEILQKTSRDRTLQNVPVILMSATKISPRDRAEGFSVGCDDYVILPAFPRELLMRVKAVLRRRNISLDSNPLTLLPGNSTILRAIEAKLEKKEVFTVLYCDLNNFKAYNDCYGFFKGDDVIKFTADVISRVVRDMAGPDDFVGHIGGDDFVVISSPDRTFELCQTIIEEFDKGIVLFYNEKDRAQKSIITKDRKGNEAVFPLMGIAIGVVDSKKRSFTQVGEVAQVGAELKKKAKSSEASSFFVDRRTPSSSGRAPGGDEGANRSKPL